MSTVNAIYNANVYIDGVNLLGQAAEFKMPEIEISQDDFDGLGLFGQVKLPSGVEALEGEITWNSINQEWANKAYHPFKAAQLMVRGNLQTFDTMGLAKEVPIVVTCSFKPKEKAEYATEFTTSEVRMVIDGRETLYYNALKNVYRVNGVDALGQFRKNIGA